jgi:arylsulfatase A-like enzyme
VNSIKKEKIVVLLILIFFLLLSCQKNRFIFMNFVDMLPYLTTEFETQEIDFGNMDNSDEKYLLEGWGKYGLSKKNKKSFRWAVGHESTLLVYFADTTEKVASMECRPFNPSNHPPQLGHIYVNGNYLQSIEFTKSGKYFFHIPSNTLNYGSNQIIIKWKYARAPRDFGLGKDSSKRVLKFFYLSFMDEDRGAKSYKKEKKISPGSYKKETMISVPPGGILEYYVDLPVSPILKLSIFSDEKIVNDSKVSIAIYNKEGEKDISNFKIGDLYQKQEHKLNLTQFENETVKIVFSNSIDNNPNSAVFWVNPVIYSHSRKGLPPFWRVEKKPIVRNVPKKDMKRSKSPNVFIYLIDTLRANHLSCYGHKKKITPFIDEFSKDGFLFDNCFASANWTRPAVSSILTGLYPYKHGVETKKDSVSSELVMISEILRSMGYSTIHLTSTVHASKAFNFDQGVDYYSRCDTENKSSELINSDFSKLINNNPDLLKKPIYAFLHTDDPHDPYAPRAPFLKFKKAIETEKNFPIWPKMRAKIKKHNLTEEEIDFVMSLYDCEISKSDYYFGKFIDYLKQRGLYENSIIVLIGDHGEQFDEHGGFFHGGSIYNEEIRVPLIIKFPNGEFSGCQSNLFVSQVDVLPTILEYLGVEIPSCVDGISLLYQLKKVDLKRTIFINVNHRNSNLNGFIFTLDKTKLITRHKDKSYANVMSYEMYNLENDFHESNCLFKAGSPFYTGSIKFRIDCLLENMERSALKK